MSNFEVLSIDVDDRLRAVCVTVRATYDWYLTATRGAEDNLSIQRKIIGGRKSYQTLRADLVRGCVLPPIVLATMSAKVPSSLSYKAIGSTKRRSKSSISKLSAALVKTTDFYIVDGLQRTNALRQVCDELEEPGKAEFLARALRLEIWLDISFGALAYRMLLLNAGQRPMSIPHQVEILSEKLAKDLSDILGLTIFTRNDGRRRVQPGQFALSRVAQAFQAWLQGQPNLDIRNTVMEQLLAESAIETLGHSLSGPARTEDRDAFHDFFKWLVQLDHAIGEEHREFLGNDTVLQGVAAAFGSVTRKADHQAKAKKAAAKMLSSQKKGDSLRIEMFDQLRRGIDPKRQNVGDATRQMVYRAFEEYLRSGGEKEMAECWQLGA